jgi:hypothetical protein
MRLDRLRLENFRGFAELDVDFSRAGNLAVMVGANGAGKSSVLECIGIFLGRFVERAANLPELTGMTNLTAKDVRRGAEHARAIAYFGGTVPFTDEVCRNTEPSPGLGTSLFDYVTKLRESPTTNVPAPLHYRAYRGAGDLFEDFLRWFRVEEDAENRERLRRDPAYRSRSLSAMRRAMEGVMRGLPRAARFENLRAEQIALETSGAFKVTEEVDYMIDKDDTTLSITQLSNGERSTLYLVADLALHLAMASPGLEDPLQGRGIALIDEIESHLHPAWQRAILPGLTRAFPNVQFIVTTHSPQVLSEVQRESVLILDDFKLIEAKPHTYGRDSNAILQELMGVPERPEEAGERIRRIAWLIDENDLAGARRELTGLALWLGEQDAEIVRLDTLIGILSPSNGHEAHS